jgi:EAL domain-containing protein (putative c-di-GMP-specific phosphodiesterase class I)/GGDEF domain-containing protein
MPQALIRQLPLQKTPPQASNGDLCAGEGELLRAFISMDMLSAAFQPIMDFKAHAYIAFEGLIRGPENTPYHAPQELFAAAERHGLRLELERACRETVFRAFARSQLPGKLFINASPDSLDDEVFRNGGTLDLLRQLGISPSRVVIELTENQRISDFPAIHQTLSHYRSLGYQIAIDDLGEGFANLRMWSEVKPEYVKIDRHFINGIADDHLKFQFVKAMQSLAETCSARIIAEGIENEADCLAVRDLGIACGQGYLIAMPTAAPRPIPAESMVSILRRRRISVFPNGSAQNGKVTVRSLARAIAPLTADTHNELVYRRFEAEPELISLPVVVDGVPLGLINRHALIDRFARPFRRELYGRKPCAQFMDPLPLIINEDATVQEAGLLISRSAHHHLYDGFIVTDKGQYLGVGSAHDLMGMITEMQIQAARYANPLTHLPGNVPINEHIDRLLEQHIAFSACYFDIDHFKPFNDKYGYRKGDDIIQLVAQIARDIADPHSDFIGHIGGDDFMLLFQSNDWEARCARALRLFDQGIAHILPPEDLHNGQYLGENRRGETVFYSAPTLSIGALQVFAGDFDSHQAISAVAASAKKHAKKMPGSSLFIERRRRQAGAESAEMQGSLRADALNAC